MTGRIEWVVRRGGGRFGYEWRWRFLSYGAGHSIWIDGGETLTKRGAHRQLQRSLHRHVNGGRRTPGPVVNRGETRVGVSLNSLRETVKAPGG